MVSLTFVILLAALFVLPALAASHPGGLYGWAPPPAADVARGRARYGRNHPGLHVDAQGRCYRWVRGHRLDEMCPGQLGDRSGSGAGETTGDEPTTFTVLSFPLSGYIYGSLIPAPSALDMARQICEGRTSPYGGKGPPPSTLGNIVYPPGTFGDVYYLPDATGPFGVPDPFGGGGGIPTPPPGGEGSGGGVVTGDIPGPRRRPGGTGDDIDDDDGDIDDYDDDDHDGSGTAPVEPPDGVGGDPTQPIESDTTDIVTKNKAVIRNNLVYHFPDIDLMTAIEGSRAAERSRILNEFGSRMHSIEDGIRFLTLRQWYGYGWQYYGYRLPDTNRPMFGYFPVINADLDPDQIVTDLQSWYLSFALGAALGADSPGRIVGDYFSYLDSAPVPMLYISNFYGEDPGAPLDQAERSITQIIRGPDEMSLAGALRNFIENNTDIKIKHWKRSPITVKRFDFRDLEPRLPYSEAPEIFEILVDQVIEPMINLKQSHPPESGLDTTSFPLRYYDYAFEFPTVDKSITIEPVYNGYFAQSYEDTTRPATFEPGLEPLMPNLYMVDFSTSTGIEEYYRIISLNNLIREQFTLSRFPDNNTPQYVDLINPFGYSSEFLYVSCMWVKTIQELIENERVGEDLVPLALEYSKLLFSNHYKSAYDAITAEVKPHRDPFYYDVRFFLTSRTLIPHGFDIATIFNSAAHSELWPSCVYDPVVHLASDTQMSLNKREYFEGIHTDTTIGTLADGGLSERSFTVPYMLEKRKDYIFEQNNIWDINEWFKLYCLLSEETDDLAMWDLFYERFPEQRAMLEADPQFSWPLDESRPKPIPVGGTEPFSIGGGGDTPITMDIPSSVLYTPDGEVWDSCTDHRIVINALSDIYAQMDVLISKNYFRSYKDVVNGVLASSQPLFFRLEKSHIPRDAEGNLILEEKQVLQNFFFPSSLLDNDFTYIDAQAKYGLDHSYNLYGYHFVIGNEYWYEPGPVDYDPSYDPQTWTCRPGYTRVELEDGTIMCRQDDYEDIPFFGWSYTNLREETMENPEQGYGPHVLTQVRFPSTTSSDLPLSDIRQDMPYTGQDEYAMGASLRQKLWFNPPRQRQAHTRYDGDDLDEFREWAQSTDSIFGYLSAGQPKVFDGSSYPGVEMIGIFDTDVYAANTSPPSRLNPWRDNWVRAGGPTWLGPGGIDRPHDSTLPTNEVPLLVDLTRQWYAFWSGNLEERDYKWGFWPMRNTLNASQRENWKTHFRWKDPGTGALTTTIVVDGVTFFNHHSDFILVMLIKGGHLPAAAVAAARRIDEELDSFDLYSADRELIDDIANRYIYLEANVEAERDVGAIIFPRYGGIDATIPADFAHPGVNLSLTHDSYPPPTADRYPYESSITNNGEYYKGCVRRWWANDYYLYLYDPDETRPGSHPVLIYRRNPGWNRVYGFNKIVDGWQAPRIPSALATPEHPAGWNLAGMTGAELLHYDCRNMYEIRPDEPAIRPTPIDEYTFNVCNRPHPVLIESRVFSSDMSDAGITKRITAKPPLPPEVDISPYRSVNDRALVMMNSSVGKYKDSPKIIEPQDVEKYKPAIRSQYEPGSSGLISEDEYNAIDAFNIGDYPIIFEADDYPLYFEIFRIDFPPRSYRDFADARKVLLDNTDRGSIVRTSNSIVEEVVPNKKYWYTFRVVDVHEDISNPSPVLEFEIIDTGNSIYPRIQEYYFPEPDIAYDKPSKKYLMVSPASIQDAKNPNVRDAGSFLRDHPDLGDGVIYPDASIWSKNYKIRLTSKLSGKRIDINFTFKQKKPIDLDNPGEE